MFELYEWQKEAIQKLRGHDALLCAPTSAGKTEVCKRWANIDDPDQHVIFTAPIKALSNQRFSDLLEEGYDVGIDTGDFKYNTSARIICCTMEIYTNKYAEYAFNNVIIDEFHYIANNPERVRAYVDGIVKTSKESNMIIVSATFGNVRDIKVYLEKLRGNKFALYHTRERMTELVFRDKPIKMFDIHNALIFVFSVNNCRTLASRLLEVRESNKYKKLHRINYKENKKIIDTINEELDLDGTYDKYLLNGIGIYHGRLLPKEKLAFSKLYMAGIIDVMIGTDALALGVNLPAETVIFGQLARFYDGPIKPSEFLQMAGRAGRKGYYDKGYVAIGDEFDMKEFAKIESRGFRTIALYKDIKHKSPEAMVIQPDIDYLKVISCIEETKDGYNFNSLIKSTGKNTYEILNDEVEEEVKYIISATMDKVAPEKIRLNICKDLKSLQSLMHRSFFGLPKDEQKERVDLLKKCYFNEFSPFLNIKLSNDIYFDTFTPLKALQTKDIQGYLQALRYCNQLPNDIKHKYEKEILELQNDIIYVDNTISPEGFAEANRVVNNILF